jgi:hypothetical protein
VERVDRVEWRQSERERRSDSASSRVGIADEEAVASDESDGLTGPGAGTGEEEEGEGDEENGSRGPGNDIQETNEYTQNEMIRLQCSMSKNDQKDYSGEEEECNNGQWQ